MGDELHIERLGGLAGMGLPASRLRSEGRLAAGDLTAADRQAVDRLFAAPPGAHSRSRSAAGSPMRDGFRYRLTRTAPDGAPQVVELADEAQIPRALLDSIQDTLR